MAGPATTVVRQITARVPSRPPTPFRQLGDTPLGAEKREYGYRGFGSSAESTLTSARATILRRKLRISRKNVTTQLRTYQSSCILVAGIPPARTSWRSAYGLTPSVVAASVRL